MLLLQDPSRNTQQPFFYLREFLDWLFSSCNGLLEPAKKTVYQDMSRPLAHYWISSSHNTYLTGGHQEIIISVSVGEHVFGPPRSGSIGQRYKSGIIPFSQINQQKILAKN
jgi:hypothetical protein